jgi:probable rRNA maturation factor
MTGLHGARPALVIDIGVRSKLWKGTPGAAAAIRRAIRAAAARCGPREPAMVTIILSDDEAIRTVNRKWRGLDRSTNVLSFPAAKIAPPATPRHLGDVVLAYETIERECVRERKSFPDHLAHLAVHGFLHLLGYDHESDREADAMETEERAILAALGVPDPYAPARAIKKA